MVLNARLEATILVGYGCWCDTVDSDINGTPDACEAPNRRQLAGNGVVEQIDSVDMVLEGERDNNDGDWETTCGIGCQIGAFFEMLFNYLFGWL